MQTLTNLYISFYTDDRQTHMQNLFVKVKNNFIVELKLEFKSSLPFNIGDVFEPVVISIICRILHYLSSNVP